MPYKRNADLPKRVQNPLPSKAQTIFRKAFNSAEKQYSEERAFKIAWGAVKKQYREEDSKWVSKN